MGRIDRETVQKILDAADIVEVVSDFVHLKRRGANYIGLCPFHNERTPSFSVSKSKGICKCFSCGKGGSAVNFIMELEQLSFNEALRYLAKKYNIEIKERELTDKEREEADVRESMFAINDFALRHFEHNLRQTEEGRNVGLAYFRERGINDAMIERFHLGYALEGRSDLADKAKREGYSEKYLLETGLCFANDRGGVTDRFRGRVIYPVLTISGKVIAFGGRTLRKDKDVAKYVNSPESVIYKKSRELYGIYQAKQSIVKKNRCILVEGYMDVISMHQSGVENVVASSGTSLTEGQIRLIHRFTENVTVIYDSDPAGIKASLRGIDMLLAEGMNVKVVLFPQGEDPDSFAQSHSASELESYLSENETDFIAFKTRILMEGVQNDPIERSRVIQSIVRSISVIPDMITRTVYVGECSRMLGIDEKVLTLQVAKYAAEAKERELKEREREQNRIAAGLPAEPDTEDSQAIVRAPETAEPEPANVHARFLEPYEKEVARLGVRYGCMYLCDYVDESVGAPSSMRVLDYIKQELESDDIELVNKVYRDVLERALEVKKSGWEDAERAYSEEVSRKREQMYADGIEEIRNRVEDVGSIEAQEQKLHERIEDECSRMLADYSELYIGRELMNSGEDQIRRVATDLIAQKHQLSKIHTKFAKVETERDKLPDLVPHAIYNLKEALIECQIKDLMQEIKQVYETDSLNLDKIMELLARMAELNELKKDLSKYLGERVISPRKR